MTSVETIKREGYDRLIIAGPSREEVQTKVWELEMKYVSLHLTLPVQSAENMWVVTGRGYNFYKP